MIIDGTFVVELKFNGLVRETELQEVQDNMAAALTYWAENVGLTPAAAGREGTKVINIRIACMTVGANNLPATYLKPIEI